jgi:hypothetical protein
VEENRYAKYFQSMFIGLHPVILALWERGRVRARRRAFDVSRIPERWRSDSESVLELLNLEPLNRR